MVVPSTWHDVLPTIAIEALAGGRPVLGTAMGGIPYVIGTAGWVVDPDPAALADGLARAAASAGALTGAARDRYEKAFSPDRLTHSLIDVYASVAR